MKRDKGDKMPQLTLFDYPDSEKIVIKRKNIKTELIRLTPELMDSFGCSKKGRPKEQSYLLRVISLVDFKTRKIERRDIWLRRSTIELLIKGFYEMSFCQLTKDDADFEEAK